MIKKFLISTLILTGLFLLNLSLPFSVYAETNYGDGSYGTGKYNVGEVTAATTTNTTTTATSNPSAPKCNDTTPTGKEAWPYQGNTNNSNSITLRFVHWQTPVSYFALEYGTEPGEYRFGVDSFGDTNSTSYTVKSLAPNTTYYFRVRTGNGCAPGEWSNELSIKTLGWLATNQIQVEDVVLKSKSETKEEIQSKKSDPKQSGYNVKVKVLDENKKPVEGAKVTIHSKVQETITNQDGIAEFSEVEPGDHRVIITYNDYEGEQALNLMGDIKQFDLNITITTKKTVFSPISLAIIGILGIALTSIIVILIKKKK